MGLGQSLSCLVALPGGEYTQPIPQVEELLHSWLLPSLPFIGWGMEMRSWGTWVKDAELRPCPPSGQSSLSVGFQPLSSPPW